MINMTMTVNNNNDDDDDMNDLSIYLSIYLAIHIYIHTYMHTALPCQLVANECVLFLAETRG